MLKKKTLMTSNRMCGIFLFFMFVLRAGNAAAIPGDINANGFIDLEDAILGLKIFTGVSVQLPADIHIDADANGDLKIGMPEVLYAIRKVATEADSGGVYYVAKNGSDSNPGTEQQPWRTIQKAADTLGPGEKVLIRQGTYNESVEPANSGETGRHITYASYPGETVTIDGTGVATPWAGWGGLFHVNKKSFVRISGLRVINSPVNGIFIGKSSDCVVENNYTYETYTSGIGVWESENILVEGNEVELACNDGGNECITIAETDGFEVRNNRIHDGGPGTNGGAGINAKHGSRNGLIANNVVWNLNRTGIYVDSWDRNSYNIEVSGNISYGNKTGFALGSEQGGLLEDIRLFNNIAHSNKGSGLAIGEWGGGANHPMNDLLIINNTFHDNGQGAGGGIKIQNDEANNIRIRNNILSQNLTFQILIQSSGSDLVIDHNLIDGFRDINGEVRGSDCVEGDPSFANAGDNDYHINAGSIAIDGGSAMDAPSVDFDGNNRPGTGGMDIGAFEYQ